jgi:hypothetical protein
VHYQEPSVCAERSLRDVSCPSARLCAALDQAGNVVVSTDPAADPSAWIVAYAEPPDTDSGLDRADCTSARFCFGTDYWGNFLASLNPAARQSAWTASGLRTAGSEDGPSAPLGHVIGEAACSSSSACIATSGEGRLFATADPSARAPAWKPTGLDAVASIACVAHAWCFAVDSSGRVSGTRDAGRAHSWNHAFNDAQLSDVVGRFACPSAKLCVAVDALGDLFTGSAERRAQSRR